MVHPTVLCKTNILHNHDITVWAFFVGHVPLGVQQVYIKLAAVDKPSHNLIIFLFWSGNDTTAHLRLVFTKKGPLPPCRHCKCLLLWVFSYFELLKSESPLPETISVVFLATEKVVRLLLAQQNSLLRSSIKILMAKQLVNSNRNWISRIPAVSVRFAIGHLCLPTPTYGILVQQLSNSLTGNSRTTSFLNMYL